jgi:hypothetical protein
MYLGVIRVEGYYMLKWLLGISSAGIRRNVNFTKTVLHAAS